MAAQAASQWWQHKQLDKAYCRYQLTAQNRTIHKFYIVKLKGEKKAKKEFFFFLFFFPFSFSRKERAEVMVWNGVWIGGLMLLGSQSFMLQCVISVAFVFVECEVLGLLYFFKKECVPS